MYDLHYTAPFFFQSIFSTKGFERNKFTRQNQVPDILEKKREKFKYFWKKDYHFRFYDRQKTTHMRHGPCTIEEM